MCGVGVGLDERPELFFVLRGVEVESLISTAISDPSERLLKKPDEVPASWRMTPRNSSGLTRCRASAQQSAELLSKLQAVAA